MNPHYSVVAPRAAHRCEYCHGPECIFNFPFEVEHIVPETHQGRDEESNWALAYRSCNLSKSNHLTGLDDTTGSDARLYHTRLHFSNKGGGRSTSIRGSQFDERGRQ